MASGLDEKAGDKYRILDKSFYLSCGTSEGLFSAMGWAETPASAETWSKKQRESQENYK